MGFSADVEYPQTFVAFDDIKGIIDPLKKRGIKTFVFTNQSCIARKKDGSYDFAAEFRSYGFDDWFICPHDDADQCDCRKPKNGLLLQAAEKYGVNLQNCLVIGDRLTDIEAGVASGCGGILVKTGRGEAERIKNETKKVPLCYFATDLKEAVRWICDSQDSLQ